LRKKKRSGIFKPAAVLKRGTTSPEGGCKTGLKKNSGREKQKDRDRSEKSTMAAKRDREKRTRLTQEKGGRRRGQIPSRVPGGTRKNAKKGSEEKPLLAIAPRWLKKRGRQKYPKIHAQGANNS